MAMVEEKSTVSPAGKVPSPARQTTPISFPQTFEVKYLGTRPAVGLWGIKHTREPVDQMVGAAKELESGASLPVLKLTVTEKGVAIAPGKNTQADEGFYPIE